MTLIGGEKMTKRTTTTGIVEADGSFKLSTYAGFDGAPLGEYQVTVTLGKSSVKNLPAKYAKTATSGLTATIQAGKNEIVIELKK